MIRGENNKKIMKNSQREKHKGEVTTRERETKNKECDDAIERA